MILKLYNGQPQDENAPFAQGAIDLYFTSQIFYDAVANGQPEARAFSYLLGCEEGQEYLVQDLRSHTFARVGNRDIDIFIVSIGRDGDFSGPVIKGVYTVVYNI